MSSSALGAKHIHRFILLKIFSTGQWKFSDFVTNYIPVGPKAPEPPEPGLLTLFLSSTLKAKIEAHFCCSTMTFGIRFRSGAVESTFLYRSSMFLNLETLSFSHRKPSKVMDRSLVSCEAKNRVKTPLVQITFDLRNSSTIN